VSVKVRWFTLKVSVRNKKHRIIVISVDDVGDKFLLIFHFNLNFGNLYFLLFVNFILNINSTKTGAWKTMDVDIQFNKTNESSRFSNGDVDNNTDEKVKTIVTDASSSKEVAGEGKKHDKKGNRESHQDAKGGNKGDEKRDQTKTTNPEKLSNKSSSSPTKEKQQKNRSGQAQRKKQNNKKKSKKSNSVSKTKSRKQFFLKKCLNQVEYSLTDPNALAGSDHSAYLRNFMDVEGYIPATYVFQLTGCYIFSKGNLKYDDLWKGLMLKAKKGNSKLEVDETNETVRMKATNKDACPWTKWLVPNTEGGFGCPRWQTSDLSQDLEDNTPPDVVKATSETDSSMTNSSSDSINANDFEDMENRLATQTSECLQVQ